jgi:Mg2+-importing ATPase
MDTVLIQDLRDEYQRLSADGFRVLAVAYKDLERLAAYSKNDEKLNLVLRGYVAFLDPPKESAGPAIAALQNMASSVKILTGDNDLVSKKVCHDVGLPTEHIVLGSDIEKMSDEELLAAARKATIFARLSPAHKKRYHRGPACQRTCGWLHG